MNAVQFVPGQRWVSDTEPDLGLGIVEDYGDRAVVVAFPAAGERRTYAAGNAPLSRVEYVVGDRATTAEEVSFEVTDRVEAHGTLVYHGIDEHGNAVEVEEIDLDSFVHLASPRDRLLAGQIDTDSAFRLRASTLVHADYLDRSPARGFLGPRVQLLPHQLYIANEVSRRHAPRVLLADEVGLGKTIEAGLILHRLVVSGRATRALIVVPDALVHQWLVEMLRRFNLTFTILDEERCEALESSGSDNPFEAAQLVLCALSLLVDNAGRHQQAIAAGWDLLVADEAHHLAWSEKGASLPYERIAALSGATAGVLLLTATPEQIGVDGHFARLRLLDPDRFTDLARFHEEEVGYRALGDLVAELTSDDALHRLGHDEALGAHVAQYLGAEKVHALRSKLDDDEPSPQSVLDEVIDLLLDHHGTGRILFRNTRSTVGGFPERKLQPHPLPSPPDYEQQAADAGVEALIQPETLLGDQWLALDPRVVWLSEWLTAHRGEKALVICARADAAQVLELHLRLRRGIRSAVFHERMHLVARDRAAAYFAEPDEGAQVLVCSEIGSEGRNFQFARHLVLFDLPLHADVLEQRIGRLDRIGQRHQVLVHVPHYTTGATSVLVQWYDAGVDAFTRPPPSGERLAREVGEALRRCLVDADAAGEVDALVTRTRLVTEAMRAELAGGRDRLIERNSCRPGTARALVDAVTSEARAEALADYMERVFDHFGVEHQVHGDRSIVVRPGEHMFVDSFPGLPEDGMTATFDREEALAREDLHFLTWEHPLVSGAIDAVLSDRVGNATVASIEMPPLPPGRMLVEVLFALHCPAPRELQIRRYFSGSLARVVIAEDGKDLAKILTSARIDARAQAVPIETARAVVQHARIKIVELVRTAEAIVAPRLTALIEEADRNVTTSRGGEADRLRTLSRANPAIRAEEIEALETETEAMHDYIRRTQLRADALRVLVTT